LTVGQGAVQVVDSNMSEAKGMSESMTVEKAVFL
jgi:hypothetical protein